MIISKAELGTFIERCKNDDNVDNVWRLYSDVKTFIYLEYGWFNNCNDYEETIENLTDLLGI